MSMFMPDLLLHPWSDRANLERPAVHENTKNSPLCFEKTRGPRAVNYKHLHYFMQVAKLGGVQRASERLHVTPQTISGQVQSLENSLGGALFQRSGRGMVLTEVGRLVLGY